MYENNLRTLIIDLHNLDESQAIMRIDSALWELKDELWDELEIITGNGEVLRGVAIEQVEKDGFRWRHENGNTGSIIVTIN